MRYGRPESEEIRHPTTESKVLPQGILLSLKCSKCSSAAMTRDNAEVFGEN
jgi:hypothetical protein